ncbi:type II toxin-antitoxin system VapC family toxin [Aquipuribacter sp. SD81]|uniref:type II toxin-antitoxin system VapC family toxin n=1 Tax=Aquipuribacter sp. SD81 TaxID=3127703 RepID=UPI00301A0B6B
MILVDTSAWVDFDRATGSPTDEHLVHLLRDRPDELATTEPVLMEVLAGARSDTAARRLRSLLLSVRLLPVEPAADFEGAATVYRTCRRRGITPHGLRDCLITCVAMRTGSRLLTADADFRRMTTVLPLVLEEP